MVAVTPKGFIDIEIVGDRNSVERMLMRLDSALAPTALSYWMSSTIAPWIRQRAKQRFANEGDDAVEKWAPLEPVTQQIRSKGDWPVGPSGPINRRTGELEAYITGSDAMVTALGAGASLVYPARKPTGELADKVETAQEGRAGPRTVPRPVLGLGERDLAYVLTTLAFHVQGGRTGPND